MVAYLINSVNNKKKNNHEIAQSTELSVCSFLHFPYKLTPLIILFKCIACFYYGSQRRRKTRETILLTFIHSFISTSAVNCKILNKYFCISHITTMNPSHFIISLSCLNPRLSFLKIFILAVCIIFALNVTIACHFWLYFRFIVFILFPSFSMP